MSSKVNEYGFLINIRAAKPPSSFLRVFYCLRRFFHFSLGVFKFDDGF